MMRHFTLLIAFTCLTFLGSGCATDQTVISQAASMNTQLEPAVINDSEVAGYLQRVGDRIIETARQLDQQGYGPSSHKQGDTAWMFSKNMKFHFVNSKTLNAFTTGGEHMYIYNQLFQECGDEDELAAVMAHEYGHVYARHVAKGMNRQYTALAAAAALGGAGYVAGGKDKGAQYAGLGAGAGAIAGQFLNMGFTRKDEAEADKLGFNFYTHAGWDPNQFAAFFQHMIEKGYDKTPAIASDHPTLASRVDDAKRRVSELPPQAASWRRPPIAGPAEFGKLKQRASQLAASLPDDKSLANSQQLLQALPRSCVVPVDPPDAVEARHVIAKKAEAAQSGSPQAVAAPKKKKKPQPAAQ